MENNMNSPSCSGSIVCIISCNRPWRNFAPVCVLLVFAPLVLPVVPAPLEPAAPDRVSEAALDVTDPPGCVAIDVSEELAAFPFLFIIAYVRLSFIIDVGQCFTTCNDLYVLNICWVCMYACVCVCVWWWLCVNCRAIEKEKRRQIETHFLLSITFHNHIKMDRKQIWIWAGKFFFRILTRIKDNGVKDIWGRDSYVFMCSVG